MDCCEGMILRMGNTHICPNCFKEIQEETCPYCKFQRKDDKRELYHLPVGTVLQDRFIIGKVLGFGGFGITYKAWDQNLGFAVAVKEYYPSGLVTRTPGSTNVIVFSNNEEKEKAYRNGKSRFQDEARNMAMFKDHPYIVNVYNYFQENNTSYIVMEYLDGITLKKYLFSVGGKMNYEDTFAVVEPIMVALEELHRHKILHRDISPDNIFITKDNRIKLLDFGAARFSTGETESTLTAVVKPGYAPPEQYQSHSKQGAYTDVYALGATIYKMVVGELPEESIDRAVNDELQKPSELGIELPLNAEKAIMKAMAVKPGLRFQKVSDMRAAFGNKKEIDYPEVEQAKRRKRNILLSFFSLCAMIMVLAGSYLFYSFIAIEADKIEKDDLTVWVLQNEDGTASPFRDLATGFINLEGNEKFGINIIEVPEDEYSARLNKAFGTEDFPDLFLADYAEEKKMSASVWSYYLYFNMDDYYFLKESQNTLVANKKIPVAFSVPVVFVNTGLMAKTGNEPPEVFASLDDFSYDITRVKEKELAQYALTGKPEMQALVGRILSASESQWQALENYSFTKNAFSEFSERNAMIYLGMSNEMEEIQKAEKLKGTYSLVPVTGEKIYGKWSTSFCIGKETTANRKKLAMLFLSYLSSSGSNIGFPLQKEEFGEYIDSNERFYGFMKEADENGTIYEERILILDS